MILTTIIFMRRTTFVSLGEKSTEEQLKVEKKYSRRQDRKRKEILSHSVINGEKLS